MRGIIANQKRINISIDKSLIIMMFLYTDQSLYIVLTG